MLNPVRSSQFKKDLKKARRQGKDLDKLQAVVLALSEGRPLEESFRDHDLTGNGGVIASAM